MGTTTPAKITPFSIVDQDISRSAAINAACTQHAYKPNSRGNVAIGATPVTYEEIIYAATGVATVAGFHAMLNACGSATSITVDLKKNGVSILTSVITLANTTGNKVFVDATIASPTLAAGDILSVSWTVSTSTGAQGPFAYASIIENSPPA